MVGWAKTLTGSFAGGLYALAVCALASAVISLFWLRIPRAIATGEELAARGGLGRSVSRRFIGARPA